MMPCIRQIVQDLKQNKSPAKISAKFHFTMVNAFMETALKVAGKTNIKKCVLSGGVFNNELVLTGMIKNLEENNIKVYTHTKVPCGDGGISLGQVVVATGLVPYR
jgi:hydrogenase maturation protein HypF